MPSAPPWVRGLTTRNTADPPPADLTRYVEGFSNFSIGNSLSGKLEIQSRTGLCRGPPHDMKLRTRKGASWRQ